MYFQSIATPVALLWQVTSGAVMGVFVGEVVAPGVTLDPALVAAYGAIGALFSLYTWSTKGRIERLEKREDTILSSDSEKTVTMRELTAAVAKAAEVTANAVIAATGAVEESKRNGGKLDSVSTAVNDLNRTVAEHTRTVERLCDLEDKRQRLERGRGYGE